ncbi:hypothetical protein HK413_09830 [Mucilaginibacter sp. S1162]|uniref:Uncharacterized protein n=1 Tax=Mucilaginibacter humi TaxID=2732510 RepID=A0ABX1W2A5_9SPHI|nr:hypothetical protein [Mucilaginibacter humi]
MFGDFSSFSGDKEINSTANNVVLSNHSRRFYAACHASATVPIDMYTQRQLPVMMYKEVKNQEEKTIPQSTSETVPCPHDENY